MATPMTYEVLIDNVAQAGNFATRQEADAAAVAARQASPSKTITVRDRDGGPQLPRGAV